MFNVRFRMTYIRMNMNKYERIRMNVNKITNEKTYEITNEIRMNTMGAKKIFIIEI